MGQPRPPQDVRKRGRRRDPQTGPGGGAAYEGGYGAGGLDAGADRLSHGNAAQNADPWDAPGVTPDGRRTGGSTDGPRMPMDEEAEPDPDRPQDQR